LQDLEGLRPLASGIFAAPRAVAEHGSPTMTFPRLHEVSKAFGGVRALRSVSFDLEAGEVHALVGENGAGKSTLVRILTGAHAPDSGTIEIAGRRIDRADPVDMRALGVAPIYQQPALFPDLTVAENLAVGLEPTGVWRMVSWRRRRQRARELLARVGAGIDVDAPARTLRMAEQQLVEIARALGADARIVLMDEPTASLTDREAARLFELVHDLRACCSASRHLTVASFVWEHAPLVSRHLLPPSNWALRTGPRIAGGTASSPRCPLRPTRRSPAFARSRVRAFSISRKSAPSRRPTWNGSPSRRVRSRRQLRRYRGATSRRWRSPDGSPPARTCSCSTSRRRASTSAPRPRFTTSSWISPRRDWRSC